MKTFLRSRNIQFAFLNRCLLVNSSLEFRFGFKHRAFASLAQDVRSDATFRIPIIDFSKYSTATSITVKRHTAGEIVNAFKEVGFVYLSGHGISQKVIRDTFQKSAEFFKLPLDVKNKSAWDDPRANRGYVKMGRERVTQSSDAAEIAALRSKAPDSKESMEIGRDTDKLYKNKWPVETDCPGFKNTMLQFFETCHNLHVLVMQSIALGLELDENYFDNKINQKYHNLRILSYPPIKREILNQEGQARAGAHSDYGTLTLLFQDSVGGLEVQNPHTRHYQAATPIPGTIVVNVGDLLSRWSNDVLRSTLHRVVAPSATTVNGDERITPARQSIAFFCNPNGNTLIECLPNCFGPHRVKKYESVTTEDYIVGRLSHTYA